MLDKKDYTTLPLEALVAKEKKIKTNQLLSGVVVGFLVGVMIYGLVKNGFGFVYLAIPLFLIVVIYRNSQVQKQNLQQIQSEIKRRSEP